MASLSEECECESVSVNDLVGIISKITRAKLAFQPLWQLCLCDCTVNTVLHPLSPRTLSSYCLEGIWQQLVLTSSGPAGLQHQHCDTTTTPPLQPTSPVSPSPPADNTHRSSWCHHSSSQELPTQISQHPFIYWCQHDYDYDSPWFVCFINLVCGVANVLVGW